MKKSGLLFRLFYKIRWAIYLQIATMRMYYYAFTATEEYVAFRYDGRCYECSRCSNVKMSILGFFFSSEVRTDVRPYREWVTNNEYTSACGNVTALDKENGCIILTDLYSEEETPTEVKMTVQQFIQLLDDWENKVCIPRPQKVRITYKDDQFIIDTTD